ncbi:MAG: L-rhamnose/proton symporter RhaT [Opitutaceae bacterium]|jgi:L-rhamnose-H+ transport protein|nr:L-rhamnose/proton symporter RhaT [Opitutaceae bacterium]
MPTSFLGVIFHWLGGLASGSFYVPYKGVKKWSWETYWLVGGFFSWIICPIFFASVMTNDLFAVIRAQSWNTLFFTYLFGVMWGMGGLTFGLTMRYLGMSLGMGVALGYCTVFGTLLPPIFKVFVDVPNEYIAETIGQISATTPGRITLAGIVVTMAGIAVAAYAGLTKEREMPEAEKKKAIAEFNFRKGILVATFSGVMSAGMAFAMSAGNPIGAASLAAGTDVIWTGLPKLVVILLGGFTTNFIWCVLLNIKNRTGYQYLASHVRPEHAGVAPMPLAGGPAAAPSPEQLKVPVAPNYLFSALAGATWYFQFFFYTMGETKMKAANSDFASWTLHMASIIIFSTLWGIWFKEWKGASAKARGLIFAGIATLVFSTVVIGFGTWLKTRG